MSRRSMRRRACAHLLAMAATVSARAFTLSDFQLITSNTIPLHCITAYNLPLLGCRKSDFAKDRTCSASCLVSIQAVTAGIQIACYNVNPDPSTLLGQAVAGNLVDRICPGETSTTTSTRVVTRTVGSFTAIPTPTTLQTTTAVVTTAQDITSTIPAPATTASSEDQESETPTTTELPTGTSTTEPQPTETLDTTEPATETPTTPVVTTTFTPPQTTRAQQTARPSQPDDSDESPGGSPFDPVTANLGASQQLSRRLEAFLFVSTIVFLLLR